MNAYKFDVRVGLDGKIVIPDMKDLVNLNVEVIIVPEYEKKGKNKLGLKSSGKTFTNRWAGSITNPYGENPRIDFLAEKYK